MYQVESCNLKNPATGRRLDALAIRKAWSVSLYPYHRSTSAEVVGQVKRPRGARAKLSMSAEIKMVPKFQSYGVYSALSNSAVWIDPAIVPNMRSVLRVQQPDACKVK